MKQRHDTIEVVLDLANRAPEFAVFGPPVAEPEGLGRVAAAAEPGRWVKREELERGHRGRRHRHDIGGGHRGAAARRHRRRRHADDREQSGREGPLVLVDLA
mgnify:CR=1 FL=1